MVISICCILELLLKAYLNKDYEAMERSINDIYLTTLARGNRNFSNQQKETIETIAGLCPLLGGIAVYKARSLLYTYNDSIYFNNEATCPDPGVLYRLASAEPDSTVKTENKGTKGSKTITIGKPKENHHYFNKPPYTRPVRTVV